MIPIMRRAVHAAGASGPPPETVVPSYVAKYGPDNGAGEKTLTNDDGALVNVTLATGDLLLVYLNAMPDGVNNPGGPTLAWEGGSDAFTSVGVALAYSAGAGLLDCFALRATAGGTGYVTVLYENGEAPPSYLAVVAVKVTGCASGTPTATNSASRTSTTPASGTVASPVHGLVIGAVGWVTNPTNKGTWGVLTLLKALAGNASLEVAALVTTDTMPRQANKTMATYAGWGARVASFTAS